MMKLRRNKKAQVYLVFVAIFTVIALTYALVNLDKAKEIKDANGKDILIGTKQTKVFASLQDADAVNMYLQKAAELSTSTAMNTIQTSCMINLGIEQIEDKWKSECGKYLYPQWSDSKKLCLPNCQKAFIDAFTQDLSVRLNYYTRQTGVPIPKIYALNISLFDKYFILQGISSVSADFKVLDLDERTQTTIATEKPYLAAEAESEPVEPPNPDCDSVEICNDNKDNDCDTYIDCDDNDCAQDNDCIAKKKTEEKLLFQCVPEETRACGKCGTRICLSDGQWSQTCENQGECSAGSTTDCNAANGYAGKKICSAQCKWQGCASNLRCGDNKRDGSEQCDGDTNVKCTTTGGKEGTKNCKSDCTWDICKEYVSTKPSPPERPGDNPDFGLFTWPVQTSSKILTSCFGQRIVSGGSANHPGIDIAGANGDTVIAAAAGKIEYVDSGCWGRVIINHGNGLKTEYMHMSKILVTVGQEVKKGEKIGAVGGSGQNSAKCGVDDNTKATKCCNTAYAPHLHLGVVYDNVLQNIKYDKKFSLTDTANNKKVDYPSQELDIDGKAFKNYISPLCFFAKDAYTKKTTNNEECFTPANVELDNVCRIYTLPDFTSVAATSTKSSVPEIPTGAAIATITGAAARETPEASITAEGALALSNDFGTYSFRPAFTVRVNKNIDDPVKSLTDWFSNTWNACQDDPQKCINEKIAEYNNNANNVFTLSFADKCEKYPVFYDFMEALEDCFSQKAFKCSCEFNFTKSFSRKDLRIVFDTSTNKVSLFVKEGDALQQAADYSLFYGKIKPTLADQRYYAFVLDFDEKTGVLISVSMTPFKEGENPGLDTYSFKDYKIARIAKAEQGSGQFIGNNMVKCDYSKDKFRLCAKPKLMLVSELFQLKFSFQVKDKPPEPPKKGDIDCTEVNPSSSSDINNLFSLLGIVYPQFGFMFNYMQILQSLPASKPRSLECFGKIQTDKNGKPLDVAGYKVYCNDYLTNMLPKDYIEKYNPTNFVVLANQQANARISQLDKYVNTNTYSDFLAGKDCNVPVTKLSGETIQVPGIKGIVQGDKMIFNVNDCGNFPIIADKILKKDYCITLIPVDKNGNELSADAISNCVKTNSLIDLAIDEMIKRQLGSFIPTDIVPKELQSYIKLPGASEIADAASGKRDFNIIEFVNTNQLSADMEAAAQGLITNALNREIIGTSFINSVDHLDVWGKQTVLNTLSSQIKNEDANIIFDNFVSGNNVNDAVKQRAIARGVDYVDKSKAPEVLKELARGADAETLAYQELINAASSQLSSEDKKQDLIDIANSGSAEEVRDKVINKAIEKGCTENYGISVEQATNCLRNDEIDDIYYDALTSIETPDYAKQMLLSRAVDKLGDKAPEVLQGVAAIQDFQGTAQQMLINELSKLPESDKKQFVTDALQGRFTDASEIQSEIVKMIPSINTDYISSLLKSGNIKSLIEANLKLEIEKQVNSFISRGCAKATTSTGNI